MANIMSGLQSMFDNIIQDIQLIIDNLRGVCFCCVVLRGSLLYCWSVINGLAVSVYAIWFYILEMDNEGVSEENYSSDAYWNKMRKQSITREFITPTPYSPFEKLLYILCNFRWNCQSSVSMCDEILHCIQWATRPDSQGLWNNLRQLIVVIV